MIKCTVSLHSRIILFVRWDYVVEKGCVELGGSSGVVERKARHNSPLETNLVFILYEGLGRTSTENA